MSPSDLPEKCDKQAERGRDRVSNDASLLTIHQGGRVEYTDSLTGGA